MHTAHVRKSKYIVYGPMRYAVVVVRILCLQFAIRLRPLERM